MRHYRDPVWSRAGNWLAFTAPYQHQGVSKTVIAKVRTTPGVQHHRLWSEYLLVTCCQQYHESQPSWSPDDKRIAFTSDKIGGPWGTEIFTTTSEGFVDPNDPLLPQLPVLPRWPPPPAPPSSPESWQRITYKLGDDGGPAWRGQRIAFGGASPELISSSSGSGGMATAAVTPQSWAGGWEDIFIIKADGTVLVNVTDRVGFKDRDPAWRPQHPRSAASGSGRDNSGNISVPAPRP